jgi:hypothetical protein
MLWARLAIALLCCWAASAFAADPWCRPGGASALRFEWIPASKAEPRVGSVRIKDESGKTVQVLDAVENHYGGSELPLGRRDDFNNDGCPDLAVTNSIAGIGNESLTVFLYDPRAKRFEENEALSGIGGLNVDPHDRNCVNGEWKGGAEDVYTSRHCWRRGKLVPIKEYSVSPLYNRKGELACYEHVETTYRGGRKRTRTRCTQKF